MSESEGSPFVQLSSGALAGMFAETCVHPIDTIRVRLQHQRGEGEYRGLFQSFGRVFQKEGVRGLFGGLPPVLLFTMPAHALYFFGYESTKKLLQPHKPAQEKSAWVHFSAGLVAELCGAILWTPQDVVKQRLQVMERGSRPSTVSIMRDIVQKHGVKGLWKGFVPSLLTYGPFVGVYFVSYEKSKLISKYMLGVTSEDDIPFSHFLVGGALSGAIAAGVTCPLDVIKTRIQIETSPQYATVASSFRTMLKEEGASVFWKGLSARISWIAPSCALTLAAYEKLKIYMNNKANA